MLSARDLVSALKEYSLKKERDSCSCVFMSEQHTEVLWEHRDRTMKSAWIGRLGPILEKQIGISLTKEKEKALLWAQLCFSKICKLKP